MPKRERKIIFTCSGFRFVFQEGHRGQMRWRTKLKWHDTQKNHPSSLWTGQSSVFPGAQAWQAVSFWKQYKFSWRIIANQNAVSYMKQTWWRINSGLGMKPTDSQRRERPAGAVEVRCSEDGGSQTQSYSHERRWVWSLPTSASH